LDFSSFQVVLGLKNLGFKAVFQPWCESMQPLVFSECDILAFTKIRYCCHSPRGGSFCVATAKFWR